MQAKRHARLVLLSVIVAELVTVLLRAGRKPLWFDELVTLHISGLQPFSRLWSALQAGADAMPPAYYFIVHLARMCPGDPQITVRLPSILGYLMTLPAVYFFLRKRLPPVTCLVGAVMIAPYWLVLTNVIGLPAEPELAKLIMPLLGSVYVPDAKLTTSPADNVCSAA